MSDLDVASDPITFGPVVLDYLQENLGIDPEWSVRTDRRLDWWPHTYRQSLVAEASRDSEDGVLLTPVTCSTDILESVPLSSQLYQALSMVNQFASLSCLVVMADKSAGPQKSEEPAKGIRSALHLPSWMKVNLTGPPPVELASLHGTVTASCRVNLHSRNPWLVRVLQAAAGLQLGQIEQLGPYWEDKLGGKFVRAAHPTTGLRIAPDEIVSVAATLYAPAGRTQSPFAGLMERVDQRTHVWSTLELSRDRLVAEVPFRDAVPRADRQRKNEPIGTALLVASADEQHPDLGHGFVIMLELPISVDAEQGPYVANFLNGAETSGMLPLQSLGAWHWKEKLRYRCFVPALLAGAWNPESCVVMMHTWITYMVARASWTHVLFEAASRSDESKRSGPEPPRAGDERLAEAAGKMSQLPGIDPNNPESLRSAAPMSAYMTDLSQAITNAVRKFTKTAPAGDAVRFMWEIIPLLFSATNEALKVRKIDDEFRQSVLQKVAELLFIQIYGDPNGSNPEVLNEKRSMYDNILQREPLWGKAWQDAASAGVEFRSYPAMLGSLFASALMDTIGFLDEKHLHEIVAEAILDARPDKFAADIAGGDRNLLLSYTRTRLGRFL